jgi:nitroreductase
MDAMEAIVTRRSVRKYTSQAVPDELVKELLEAAMYAPSAGNQQPWHFVVIRDREVMSRIPRIHPYAAMVNEAAAAVVVCGDTSMEKHKGFWVQDCSAATENLLIAAHAKGLGAVWVGIYPNGDRVKGFKELLGLPENVFPLALIPMGFPAEKKPQPERYEESRVHKDRW